MYYLVHDLFILFISLFSICIICFIIRCLLMWSWNSLWCCHFETSTLTGTNNHSLILIEMVIYMATSALSKSVYWRITICHFVSKIIRGVSDIFDTNVDIVWVLAFLVANSILSNQCIGGINTVSCTGCVLNGIYSVVEGMKGNEIIYSGFIEWGASNRLFSWFLDIKLFHVE